MWSRSGGLPLQPDQHKAGRFIIRKIPSDTESYPGYGQPTQRATADKTVTQVLLTSRSPSPLIPNKDGSSSKTKEKSWVSIWILEILGICLSLGCTGAIIGVLYSIDGKPLHTWRLIGVANSLTPNALIQILSTISKVTMLYAVAQGLGQLKWRYFQQGPRRLYDLQIFDDASRGPTGAFTLMWKVHFRAAAAFMGALIVILALAVEVLIQQVLTYPSVPAVAANMTASVGYTKGYTADLTWITSYPPSADYQTLSNSLMRGLYGFDKSASLGVFCGSGNCTFVPFDTLGVCNSCTDISDEIDISCGLWSPPMETMDGSPVRVGRGEHQGPRSSVSNPSEICNYTSPNGHTISFVWQLVDDEIQTGGSDTSTFSAVDFGSFVDAVFLNPDYNNTVWESTGFGPRGEILNYTSIAINTNASAWQVAVVNSTTADYAKIAPVAHHCEWTWCAQRYSSLRYENGSITGNDFDSRPLRLECSYDEQFYVTNCFAVPEGEPWPAGLSSSSLSNNTNLAAVTDAVNSATQPDDVFAITGISTTFFAYSVMSLLNGTLGNGTLAANSSPDLLTFSLANDGDLSATLDDLTASINQMIRDRSAQLETSHGNSWTNITLVSVNWDLLIYPAVLPILAAAFLVMTIVSTTGIPSWKSSLMAVMYHGFDHHDAEHNLDGDHDNVMNKASQNTNVQLSRRSGITRIVKFRG